MIKIILLSLFLIICNINAEEQTVENQNFSEEIFEQIEPNADCLILEDENSIICKFEVTRTSYDKQIKIEWISPSGELSRERDMIIPAGHGSIYDYRYINGRELGFWTFKVVLEDGKNYSTQFELK
ncbi:hypothetical protein GCM10012288_08690 [Malaciobacter pacificus]|jgi:hypothetical protein|nr:hypothetical protein [Malaciobacter pacificus]GGD36873.1 hypothetical protein GCM10012288_08690 [Malaciobacter pacificus]